MIVGGVLILFGVYISEQTKNKHVGMYNIFLFLLPFVDVAITIIRMKGILMKLERMLAIITYLLHHEKVKAKVLAEKFEVSIRTIYRDVDAIAQTGIPIVSYQGADGGIGIIEGYRLDQSLLTKAELSEIIAGLKGLHSINADLKTKLLIEKLSSIAHKDDYLAMSNEMMIDLSPWNDHDFLPLRIQEIQRGIRERKVIAFSYCTNNEHTKRKAEPYIIIFKQSNWYLYAYCLLREDFRLFKLRRMSDLFFSDDEFTPREFTLDQIKWDGGFDDERHSQIVLAFDKGMKYVIYDVFGAENYEYMEDGRLKVSFRMAQGNWLYGFILSFGDRVEVLEPVALRNDLMNLAESVYQIYKSNYRR